MIYSFPKNFILLSSPRTDAGRLSNHFQIFISHNVPAVYDVLPARIRALRSKDQGWQNVGDGLRGNEQSE
jgi:hypothetical protein